ncbi:MAG TPA: thiamine diphosphokinase [Anaerolineales bacterium]|nr:thiamine diphosphokinase [Anaerolineales bacterium]
MTVLRTIIFANGVLSPDTPVHEILEPGDLILAADGGARHCLAWGINPALVIGDFDSLSTADLNRLKESGAEFVRHPTRKDHTDLELALAHASARGSDEFLILGGLGGRLDHSAGALLLLASDEWSGLPIRLVDGLQSAQILRGGEILSLQGQPGDTVSLLPLTGDARGITTSGLEYPLRNETLRFGSTRGISNSLLEETGEIQMEEGMLLVVTVQVRDGV